MAGLAAETAAVTLPAGPLLAHLTRQAAAFHADAVRRAAAGLARRGRGASADLEPVEAGLAGSRDERLRRLALAALYAQAGDARGWSDARVARLRAFRADPSALVAESARFTFLPGETAPDPPSRRPRFRLGRRR